MNSSFDHPLGIDLEAHEHYSPEGRTVVRLYTSTHCDVMMVCWEPGQFSSLHEHGPSESVVQVVRGTLELQGEGRDAWRLGPGGVAVTPTGVRHRLFNPGPGRLVTFHVYAPPMETPISAPTVDARSDVAATLAREEEL